MKSAAYWKERFEMLEKASHAISQETLKELQPAFDAAERDLRREITTWFMRFAENNNASYTDAKRMLDTKSLAELKWNVQQYIKAGEENGISKDFTKELENASARVHLSRLQEIQLKTRMIYEKLFGQELKGVVHMAEDILASDYYHTCFEIMKGYGVGWPIGEIAKDDLAKVITKPWTTDGRTFSDRIWSNKSKTISELHQELSRTLILGKSPDEAIERMSALVDKSVKDARAAAARLVQTEQAYFHSVSAEKAFKDLDVEEFEIVATLDTHTSEICQDMDGQHFKMSEYEIGVTVPPFHPNCRSTVVPYFDDLDENSMRAARNADGKTYLVPADMKYKDWKKSFVDDGNKSGLKPAVQGDTMKAEGQGDYPQHPARTKEEFEMVARGIRKDISAYSSNPSKWSGTINVVKHLNDDAVGVKEWNCDISVLENVDDGILWHEMLHSCSASYYDKSIYAAHRFIEEASVEFLTRQICAERNIISIQAYEKEVLVLKSLNDLFHYGTDLEFAKELFNVPLPERYNWLEDLVRNSMISENASIKDIEEVVQFVRNLEG